jgi:predicted DNA-binding WGR domain protein
MKTYLEFNDEKSHKFWQLELKNSTFTVLYGKIGTDGKPHTKEFDTDKEAEQEATKLIKQKIKKGYKEVSSKFEQQAQSEKTTYSLDILNEYSSVFGQYQIPTTLKLLAEFEDKYGRETFGTSFYLRTENNAFDTYFDKKDKKRIQEYTNQMLPFAVADGTGGIVALWVREGNDDLENAPIIYYGSEGGISVVAQNLKEYIQILSFGAECMDGSFYHSIDEYDDDSDFKDFKSEFIHYNPNFLSFRKWMKETLNITPVEDWDEEDNDIVEGLVKNAIKKLTKSFDKWQYQFYPNPDEEIAAYKKKELARIETDLSEVIQELKATPYDASLYFKQAKLTIDKLKLIEEECSTEQKYDLYIKVLDIDPNYEEALQALADLYEYKDAEKSLSFLKRIQALKNPKKDPLSSMGSCYEDLGELEKALECYIKDVQRLPNLWGYSQEHVISICEKLNRDYIPILEKFIQEQKDSFSCKFLYNLYFKKKNYQEALKYYIMYTKVKKDLSYPEYFEFAEKFYKKNAFVEAKTAFEITIKGITRDRAKANCYNYLGVIAAKTGKDAQVIIEYYKKAIELDPSNKIYQENLNYWLNI